MNRASDLVNFLQKRGKKLSPLLILMHDHPDPDALASAWALQYLARSFGIRRSRIVYRGIIGRIENQTMVRALNIPIRQLQLKTDFKRYAHVALVDTQPTFGNNGLPEKQRATLIIDHHPVLQRNKCADCSVIIPEAGATSVILAQALLRLKKSIPARLATALAYGILSETQDLGRDTRGYDIQIFKDLLPFCDMRSLALIQNPQRPRDFFQTLNRSLDRAFLFEGLIGAHLRFVDTPDLISQTADFLLSYEGVRWSICTGRYKQRLHISIRALKPSVHAGRLLQKVLKGQVDFNNGRSKAGGHRSIAGGSVALSTPIREYDWRRLETGLVKKLIALLYKKRSFEFRYPFKV